MITDYYSSISRYIWHTTYFFGLHSTYNVTVG